MESIVKAIEKELKNTPDKLVLYEDHFECIKLMKQDNKELAYRYNASFRKYLKKALKIFDDKIALSKIDFLQKESYHIEAVDKFDSYLIFVEWNREPNKKIPDRPPRLPAWKPVPFRTSCRKREPRSAKTAATIYKILFSSLYLNYFICR